MPDHDETLSQLRSALEQEVDTYGYKASEGAIGTPWSDERVQQELYTLRKSLVHPYWTEVEIRDTFEEVGAEIIEVRRAVVLAEDGDGVILLWDPVRLSHCLAQRAGGVWVTIGINGDAVGCFLSR